MTDKPRRRLTEAGRQAAVSLSEHTLKVARPFIWHIGAALGGVPRGATAFVLRFENRFIGVTADHVMQQYMDAKTADPRLICQLGYSLIEPEHCIIARSADLDLATFAVDPTKLQDTGADTIDCRGNWPPPEVEIGNTLTLTGFLDNHRIKEGPQHYGMMAWGAHGIADAITERDIVTCYDPDQTLKAAFAVEKPPLGFNMSGCSGGPVLLIKELHGLLRWFPVGLIYKGPGDSAEGALAGFDRIHVRRLYFSGKQDERSGELPPWGIQPDGTIVEPGKGWLPD